MQRASGDALAETVGPAFELVESRPHVHVTSAGDPRGVRQSFQYSLFRRF